MSQTTEMMIAIGGVFIVAWYSLSRSAAAQHQRRLAHSSRPEEPLRNEAAEVRVEDKSSGMDEHFPGGAVRCPSCEAVYTAGRLYCECGSETVEYDQDEEPQHPELSDEAMVCIYIAPDLWRARMIKNHLADYCIHCETMPLNSAEQSDVSCTTQVSVLVPEEDADDAQTLLRKF